MSDEYASSGFKGSLVNPSINDIMPSRERESIPLYSDYATKNYPPPGDTTSSGGRRTGPPPDTFSGPAIAIQAKSKSQGGPEPPRGREQHRDAESLDTRKEAADALAARYRASRERLGGVGA